MPGKLGLSTPWTREAMTRESKLDVAEVIPDGWTLGVSMEANRSKWIFWTVDPDGKVSHKMRISASMSLTSACFYALRHWGLYKGTEYTTDAAGWVRSITDAD